MDKREPWYTVGRNVNWYGQYGICRFLKKLTIELPYNPALAVLFFVRKKSCRDICTPMSVAEFIYKSQDMETP